MSVKHRGKRGAALPFVYVNMCMTADGKIATANRANSTFSSDRDREHMMELRASADAIMSGARTVDLAPVTLGPGGVKYRKLRKRGGLREYNVRVIVSGSGSIDPAAEIFRHRFSPIVILTTAKAAPGKLKQLRRLADEVFIAGAKAIDFRRALQHLRQKYGVRRLLCEGGGALNDALFRGGLANELHLTICPKVFGGREAPTIADGEGSGFLREASQWRLKSTARHEDEMFLVYRFNPAGAAPPTARKARANPKAGSKKPK